MVTITLTTTLKAMLQILALGACGYFLVKTRLLGRRGLDILSWLLVHVFLPCFIFYKLVSFFDFNRFAGWWHIPLIGFGLTAAGFLLGWVMGALDQKFLFKDEFKALIAFQNSGYIPFLLISALPAYQQEHLYVYIFLFIIGFDVLLWTLGVWLLTKSQSPRLEFKRLLNPPLLTIVLTLILIYFGWHKGVPEGILKATSLLGKVTLSLAMIVVGGNLATTGLRRINFYDVSLAALTKLILFPLLVLIVLTVLKVEPLIGLLVMIETMMPSAVTLAVIGQHYGAPNREFIYQVIFVTHLVSIVTIPIFLALCSRLI